MTCAVQAAANPSPSCATSPLISRPPGATASSSPVALATVVGVLVEVPVMLVLVRIANRSTGSKRGDLREDRGKRDEA